MLKTVTSLFQTEQHATEAASHLEQAGILRTGIDIWSTPHNLAPLLEDAGVSRHEADTYVEGVLRGGTLVIVRCTDGEVDTAVRVLDREGALDLNELQALWRSEGGQDDTLSGLAGKIDELSKSAQAGPDINSTSQPDKMSHGRVRVQTGPVGRPSKK